MLLYLFRLMCCIHVCAIDAECCFYWSFRNLALPEHNEWHMLICVAGTLIHRLKLYGYCLSIMVLTNSQPPKCQIALVAISVLHLVGCMAILLDSYLCNISYVRVNEKRVSPTKLRSSFMQLRFEAKRVICILIIIHNTLQSNLDIFTWDENITIINEFVRRRHTNLRYVLWPSVYLVIMFYVGFMTGKALFITGPF